jgi:hypothetical protein
MKDVKPKVAMSTKKKHQIHSTSYNFSILIKLVLYNQEFVLSR